MEYDVGDEFTPEFLEWQVANRSEMLTLWGDYLDNPGTPGICLGFFAFCEEDFAKTQAAQ